MYKSSISSLGLHVLFFTIAYNGLPEIKRNIIKEQPVNIVFELPPAKETSIKTITEIKTKQNSFQKENINKQIKNIKKKINVPKPSPKKEIFKIEDRKIEKIIVKPKVKPKINKNKLKEKILKNVSNRIQPIKRKLKKNDKNLMAKGLLKSLAEAKEQNIVKSRKVDDLRKKIKKASEKEKIKTKQVNDLKNKLLAALDKKIVTSTEDVKLSMSEIDILKYHVRQCWAPPFGANYDLKGTFIDLQIDTNRDGTVINVKILEEQKYRKSPIYRATADSARRAVFECSPLPLPKEKYDRWKKFIFEFDPSFASTNG